MTLTEILEELVDNLYKCNPDDIAQAKKKIEEMFGEWIGKDKEVILDPTNFLQTPEPEARIIIGYNQAKQEIRNRVKEPK